jgi:biopolymer transport protein ExbB/TolQ
LLGTVWGIYEALAAIANAGQNHHRPAGGLGRR